MPHNVWEGHPFVRKNDPDENFNRSINLTRSRMSPKLKPKPEKKK